VFLFANSVWSVGSYPIPGPPPEEEFRSQKTRN
jgi:hypothetical protein